MASRDVSMSHISDRLILMARQQLFGNVRNQCQVSGLFLLIIMGCKASPKE
jgi:hypothetical protein